MQELGYKALKLEQLRIVTGVLRGRDVFGVLPAGFGKTLCFACLPSAYDRLRLSEDLLVIDPHPSQTTGAEGIQVEVAADIDSSTRVQFVLLCSLFSLRCSLFSTSTCIRANCHHYIPEKRITFQGNWSMIPTSPDYFRVARIVRLRQTS